MTLDLDSRQRAMLQEMGLHVWWPQTLAAAPQAEPVAAAVADRVSPATAPATTVVVSTTPQPPSAPLTAALPQDVASLDWAVLAQTIAACGACKLSVDRRAAVFGSGAAPARADWLVLGDPPDDNEERLGQPFAGQAGQLLDNMLKAVGVRRCDGAGDSAEASAMAYVSNCVKCRPARARNPEPQELATCENYLQREVALLQPKVILALGRFAAQTLLQISVPDVASTPLGKLRGRIYRYQGIPVVVSYPPSYLLRTPQDKARAWADLCLAQATALAV